MSKALLLSIPSHGHMNPLLGLANELIRNGEKVCFFSSDEFKKAVEEIGAEFVCYREDMNIFKKRSEENKSAPGTDQVKQKPTGGLIGAMLQPEKFIDGVLEQIGNTSFDYIIFSAAYPYAVTIAQILNVPAVSSFAVFATLKELMKKAKPGPAGNDKGPLGISPEILNEFKKVRQNLLEKYKVQVPEDIFSLFFNKGDLNIIYTSKYFIKNLEDYDDSFIFVGAPVYDKKYQVDFPFDKLEGKKVIYISLGTIFGNYSAELNKMFFESFGNMDAVVVMAAHDVDVVTFDIPANFIIRNYVPQLEILKYTTLAITHAGMNSMGDLLYNNVPFVSIPLGADQFYLANRAEELGATVVLDFNTLTPEAIREAANKVIDDPSYLENIKKISRSFIEAGGYKKAVEEIFKLKKERSIFD